MAHRKIEDATRGVSEEWLNKPMTRREGIELSTILGNYIDEQVDKLMELREGDLQAFRRIEQLVRLLGR